MGIFDKKPKEEKKSTLALKDETAVEEKSARSGSVSGGKGKPAVRASLKKYHVADHAILKKPLVTEKNFRSGKYVFEVLCGANKLDIKKSFFNITGKMPVKVNVIRGGGETTRFGRTKGTAKLWKKAIITLKKGEKIDSI